MTTLRKTLGAAVLALLLAYLPAAEVCAKIEGHTGVGTAPVFNLTAKEAHISTADANSLLFWGFADDDGQDNPKSTKGQVQYPGPTLIVNEGDAVTINLTNNLAEPVSLVFPGLDVQTSTVAVFQQGNRKKLTSLTPEAPAAGKQQYKFIATRPGTFYYQSGSNQDIQIRMGLFGAIIVRPKHNPTSITYTNVYPNHFDPLNPTATDAARTLTKFAYNEGSVPNLIPVPGVVATMSNIGASTGYDREFLYLVSEMDPDFQFWMEMVRDRTKNPVSFADWIDPNLRKDFTQWKPNYWFATGRTGPDDMGDPYDPNLVSQPYNCNPMMHPGEMILTRFINMGRDFHPLHTHGQHQRIVAEDGVILSSSQVNAADTNGANNYLTQTSATGADLSIEEFTLTLSAGNTFDSIFTWTGKGLGWDPYGHEICQPGQPCFYTCQPNQPCPPPAPYEYLGDHVIDFAHLNPAVIAPPMVPNGQYGKYPNNQYRPMLPDNSGPSAFQDVPPLFSPAQLTFTFGNWFSGSPYLGSILPLPPSSESQSFNLGGGYYFMWHSHAEREITNNNIFPGGMLTMMGIIPWPAPGQPDLIPAE
jgi:manganese oxidase